MALYQINYVAVEETPDGPKTTKDTMAILASSPESALATLRQIVAPIVAKVHNVDLGLEGQFLHFAPAYTD